MINSPSSSQPSRSKTRLIPRASAAAAGALVVALGALAVAAYGSPVGAFTTKGAWHFVSAPHLHPPKLQVLSRHSGLAKGEFLVANLPNAAAGNVPLTGEGGPLMLDSHAKPVWFYGVGTKLGAANLKQETYQGKPVLLWWEGVVNRYAQFTKGEYIIVNEHYKKIRTLRAAKPWTMSLHDASIIGPNIWITVYRSVSAHYKSWHGTVYDSGLQEYNLTTGKLLQTWDALKGPGGVPLSASKQPHPANGHLWDAYHLNSVQALPDGNLLVSMRNTWAVYLLNPTTGKILWTLGGKHSSFAFGPGAKFAWQHHAELVQPASGGIGTNVRMTVFNDNCTYTNHYVCQGGRPSEGEILSLNTVTNKATLVKGYRHQPPLQSAVLGSMQLLPNGNALVGWGNQRYFSEYSKSGRQLLNVTFPGFKNETYRALFTNTWVGTPFYPPAGAARKSKGKTTVFASWNGATQVAKWQVLAGPNSGHLKVAAKHARTGFETAIRLAKSAGAYEVRALNSHGKTLGTSKSFK